MLLCCGTVGVSEHTGPAVGSSSALMPMKGKNNFSLCNCINFKCGQVHHRQASEFSLMLFLSLLDVLGMDICVVTSEYSKMREYFHMQGKNSTARIVRVFK